MKFRAFVILMAIAALAHGAEMYRWVDEKGVVNYTPYPPPPNIRKVEPKKLGDSGKAPAAPAAPYSVQLAAKNFPVTFYSTAACGEPCKNGRALLDKRGVPYAEKDPSNPASPQEFEEFKKMTGGSPQVPILIVGQLRTVKGFLAAEWDAALDAAGYPTSAPAGTTPAAKPPVEASAPPAAAK
jgi:glutaredoxin